jgi:hypothetical protein
MANFEVGKNFSSLLVDWVRKLGQQSSHSPSGTSPLFMSIRMDDNQSVFEFGARQKDPTSWLRKWRYLLYAWSDCHRSCRQNLQNLLTKKPIRNYHFLAQSGRNWSLSYSVLVIIGQSQIEERPRNIFNKFSIRIFSHISDSFPIWFFQTSQVIFLRRCIFSEE